jgi:hypothetical protein
MLQTQKISMKKLLKDVQAELKAVGLKKRANTIFTKDVNSDVLGIVTIVVSAGEGGIAISTSVGVRHQALERLVAELSGQKFDESLPATIGISIGYIAPEKQYAIFRFSLEEDPHPTVREIVGTIEKYGLNWMEDHQLLDSILDAILNGKYTYRDAARLRLPVIRYLKGNIPEARTSIEKGLDEIGNAEGPVSDQYKRLSRALMSKIQIAQ